LPLLAAGRPAAAQPLDIPDTWGGDFWSRPRLTGDWGGVRDRLGKKGVAFDVDLLLTPQGVASGGRETDGELWGNSEYTLNIDTGKLGLWPGGFLKFAAISGFGSRVVGASGALDPVNTGALLPALNDETTGLTNATFSARCSTRRDGAGQRQGDDQAVRASRPSDARTPLGRTRSGSRSSRIRRTSPARWCRISSRLCRTRARSSGRSWNGSFPGCLRPRSR
jgi:hypothetical protein